MEHQPHIITELKAKVLIALITDDIDALDSAIETAFNSDCRECNVGKLLLTKHAFEPLEHPPYNRQLFQIFRKLRVHHPPSLSPVEFNDPTRALRKYLEGQQYYFIYIAVVLGRINMVTMILDRVGLDRAFILLTNRDIYRRTLLHVAIECHHVDIVNYIFQYKDGFDDMQLDRLAIREMDAFESCSSQILVDPEIVDCIDILRPKYFRFLSLNWYIYFRRSYTLGKEINRYDIVRRSLPQSLLHWTVWLYSKDRYDENKGTIVGMLRHVKCNGVILDPNAICSMTMPDEINGTVAHFAVASYRPPPLALVHPGFRADGTLNEVRDQEYGDLEDDEISVVEKMQFLHQLGVNFCKPNSYAKTPLNCLPSDSDPRIVRAVCRCMV